MSRKTVFKNNKIQIATIFVLFIVVSTGANYRSPVAMAQTTETENQSAIANVNEVKSFIYSWFALLDRQVSEISLLKFLDLDNLTMQFPETTVNNEQEFSNWYSGIQEAIESNTQDVRILEVTPLGNGEFDVKLVVDWQARTRQGETVTQTYLQQWKIVTDKRRRLTIQEYLVEEIK